MGDTNQHKRFCQACTVMVARSSVGNWPIWLWRYQVLSMTSLTDPNSWTKLDLNAGYIKASRIWSIGKQQHSLGSCHRRIWSREVGTSRSFRGRRRSPGTRWRSPEGCPSDPWMGRPHFRLFRPRNRRHLVSRPHLTENIIKFCYRGTRTQKS